MTEAPAYFAGPDGIPLYGVYHEPASPARLPVLIAPSFFEERKSAYAPLTELARALAAQGHAVLRFDYRGSGESGGDPAARRWADCVRDLAAAAEALQSKSGSERFALLGLRMGATLALLEAARLKAAAVVALAPVLSGKAQVRLWRMRSKIRAELTANDAQAGLEAKAADSVDFDGFAVAPAFFEDVEALDLLKAPPAAMPVLLLQLSHRTDPAGESQQLAKTLGAACTLEALRCEPFWDRLDKVDTAAVRARVAAWLSKR